MVPLHQEVGDVAHVVDASLQLGRGPKVVDTDEQSLALARALTVLEGILVGCSVTEALGSLGHGGRAVLSSVAGGRWVELLVVLPLGSTVALLWGRILLLRGVMLLRRVLMLLMLRRVVLLLRGALVIATVARLGRRSPLSLSLGRTPLTRRRSLVVISGAAALSWVHADN